MQRFLILPDKFKGSLPAKGVASAIRKGILQSNPEANVVVIPLADGGEGTADILSRHFQARKVRVTVSGPLNHPLKATFGIKGRTAWVDLASASGFTHLKSKQRNPMHTTTRGTGQLILAAIRKGARHVYLGLGGSATVDGGLGALKALGIRLLTPTGKAIAEGGKGLKQLHTIDYSHCLIPRGTQITLLADVNNPLVGPTGAAKVFGPQKGATPSMVRTLESGLTRLARVIVKSGGRDVRKLKSGGATGGLPAGFYGILGLVPDIQIHIRSGIGHVLETLKIEKEIRKADWIITGEGHFDSQSTHGKTVDGVARLAQKHQKPVLVIAGKVTATATQMKKMGVTSALAIPPGPCTLEESQAHTAEWIQNTVAQFSSILLTS